MPKHLVSILQLKLLNKSIFCGFNKWFWNAYISQYLLLIHFQQHGFSSSSEWMNWKFGVVVQYTFLIIWVRWLWMEMKHDNIEALQKTYIEGKCFMKDVVVIVAVFSLSHRKRNAQFHISNIYSAFRLNVKYHNSSKPHPYRIEIEMNRLPTK